VPVGVPSPKSIKLPSVVLVDDHPAVLRQTMQLLSGEFEVVEALDSGQRLAAVVAGLEPELIVLDITLPGLCGIELAAQLKKAGCPAKIIFLTAHNDPDYARAAFDAGATGYVLKPRLASDLIPALHAALEGKRFISPCPEFEELS